MSDLTREQILARAAQAKRLMEDEILREAFKSAEAQMIVAIIKSEPPDTVLRENLYQGIQVLGMVQQYIKALINSGKIAKVELDNIAKLERPAAA